MKLSSRTCITCKKELGISNFYKTATGYRRPCKKCYQKSRREFRELDRTPDRKRSREHYINNKEYYTNKTAKRRAAKLNRTLDGFAAEILEFYKDRPTGYQVDHIVPLQGKNVSGLHVPWNLQYLTPEENKRKGNKYEL